MDFLANSGDDHNEAERTSRAQLFALTYSR